MKLTPVQVGQRTALLHMPSGDASWLLVCLHPKGSNGRSFANVTQFAELADEKHFACVFPNAIRGEWNMLASARKPDDMTFLYDLITQLSSTYPSIQHVALVGYSNGAQMASAYALAHPQDVEALITCSGGFINPMLRSLGTPSQPMNVLSFWGTADDIYPYAPGAYGLGATENFQIWSMTNGTTDDSGSALIDGKTNVELRIASDGTNGTRVWLYTLVDGGHTWPGSQQTALESVLGPTNMEISATEIVWEFLSQP
jgi:polyhydroxybutyrate depolymerase